MRDVFITWKYIGDAPSNFSYRLTGEGSRLLNTILGTTHQLHFKLFPGSYHFEILANTGRASSGIVAQDFTVN